MEAAEPSEELMRELEKEKADVEEVIRLGTGGAPADTDRFRAFRGELQGLAATHSDSIRRNVVSNYAHFIHTANEISYMEGEMYNLNHFLQQQKDLIEGMMNSTFTSTFQEKELKPKSQEKMQSLQKVVEKVDGVSYLTQDRHRQLILDDDFTELSDAKRNSNVHLYLLSDALLVTMKMQRVGTKEHRLEAQYSLDQIGIKSLEDEVGIANAFRIEIFPHHRTFEAHNARVKKRWLSEVEKAKAGLLHESSLARQGTIRSKYGSVRGRAGTEESRGRADSEALDDLEWLKELPDEMEVCMAQRELETAAELLGEGREHLAEGCADADVGREVAAKLNQKERQLIALLSKELKTSAGPKAARKAIQLLIKLGKSSHAVDLYLKGRSWAIKTALKELQISEEPLSYLRSLCRIVFGALSSVAQELPTLFAGNSGSCAVLVLWASGELGNCVKEVVRHVIDPGPSLAVIAQSAKILLSQTQMLGELGLDLTFQVKALLTGPVQRSLDESTSNMMEAARLRISEEKWKPLNLQSEANLRKFLEEMADVGLGLEHLVMADPLRGEAEEGERCRLWVSPESLSTGKSAVELSADVAALSALPSVQEAGLSALLRLWALLLEHVKAGLLATKDGPPVHYKVAQASAQFLVGSVLGRCEAQLGLPSEPLQSLLATDFPALVQYRPPPAVTTQQSYQALGDV